MKGQGWRLGSRKSVVPAKPLVELLEKRVFRTICTDAGVAKSGIGGRLKPSSGFDPVQVRILSPAPRRPGKATTYAAGWLPLTLVVGDEQHDPVHAASCPR